MALFGCDTFVVLPPLTDNGDIIFGKNSDRPNGEVQEVVYFPSKYHGEGEILQCTYIEIDQVSETYPVLLSKPSWMWGAEMGANNFGLVIGNEAVWTVVDDDSHTERLLGMDLLRIALERSSSSKEAVGVISSLLEKYGQGGPCSDSDSELLYHNSFLIADQTEVWVLETAGKLWAAEKITSGFRNISNCLSIGTNISAKSNELISYAQQHNLWSGKGNFNFKDVFSAGGCPRESAGFNILTSFTSDKKFNVEKMFKVLRDKKSGICRPASDPFHTSGSWVSSLSTKDSTRPSCHWVTATPDPSVSLFKPFVFSPAPVLSEYTTSPVFRDDPAKKEQRFQFKVDRRHTLYKLHETALKISNRQTLQELQNVEKDILQDTNSILQRVENTSNDISTCNDLFKNAVEREINIYKH